MSLSPCLHTLALISGQPSALLPVEPQRCSPSPRSAQLEAHLLASPLSLSLRSLLRSAAVELPSAPSSRAPSPSSRVARSSLLTQLPVPRPCARWISRARCLGPDRARLQLEPILCLAPASSQLEFPLWPRASWRVSKPWSPSSA
uniref:Uncharacterized protein n=1 Tax=Zea mays TaxID=4577 RepID=A0A804RA90_MAIZE